MSFTAEHEQFRAMVREFIDREINPHVDAWEIEGMMPLHRLFKQMGDLGMLGLEYDAAYGGQEADHFFTVVMAEEFGRADHGSIGMAVGVQADMATPSLHSFGSAELKERYLAPAIAGEAVAAVAVTEPDAGSDVAAIRTRAVRDGDDWVINGSKMYITNSLQADWICMLIRTSDAGGYQGMSQVIVPTDSPGFEVSKKLDKFGMRASDTGLLTFTDMRVPVANTIGTEGAGFQQQMAQFVLERMWANYSAVGGMERALERTRSYLSQTNGVRRTAAQERLRALPASRTRRRTRPSETLQLHLRSGLRPWGGHHSLRDDCQAQSRPALERGGGLVSSVSWRHRLHGGNLDRPLSP